MNIRLHNETELTLSRIDEAGMDIQQDRPELDFGAMQMFATSLAMCTAAVLTSYGKRIDAGTDGMTIRLTWSYAERPYRIGEVAMDILWPEVPDSRVDAAMRAAVMCTLHKTLEHGVEVETDIRRE